MSPADVGCPSNNLRGIGTSKSKKFCGNFSVRCLSMNEHVAPESIRVLYALLSESEKGKRVEMRKELLKQDER